MKKYVNNISQFEPTRRSGQVLQYVGLVIEASGPDVFLGEYCQVYPKGMGEPISAEVVGFKDGKVLLMPFGRVNGVSLGSEVVATGRSASVPVGSELLGRVVDAFGKPLDGGPAIATEAHFPLTKEPINPLTRDTINTPIDTGVRAIDSMLTIGKGQRIGLFSGSGVGKSTLLGMLGRNINVDINVIALIGERGREVVDFISDVLGPEGMKKSIVVVATSDQPALVRTHAVYTATAISEYFAQQGNDVLLMMDSVTRFAMAQREIGLAIGEPPTARGYTPSIFSMLPAIVERCGNFKDGGSITSLYTVLVEGDDFNEPIADTMRSILDGHIVLTRELANRGHYPAIDVLKSKSRLMDKLVSKSHMEKCNNLSKSLADYEASRDLIEIGAYQSGKNPALDKTIGEVPRINQFLQQDASENVAREEAVKQMNKLES